jgi:hypothetical protein
LNLFVAGRKTFYAIQQKNSGERRHYITEALYIGKAYLGHCLLCAHVKMPVKVIRRRSMAFTLDKIVPWGRSFDEYEAMFDLSGKDLEKRILGCADGPANFNCILTKRGGHIVSVDPIYHFSAAQIRGRIRKTYEQVIKQTRKNMDEFVWDHISSVEELGRVRMNAMNDFLSDYASGQKEGRYVEGSLPALPFEDDKFDIALCSHLLFLYSEPLSEDFHFQAIKELCRVSSETRIFPLLELGAKKSRHLEKIIDRLDKAGFSVSIDNVPYEFQKGGNEMMKIKHTKRICQAYPE